MIVEGEPTHALPSRQKPIGRGWPHGQIRVADRTDVHPTIIRPLGANFRTGLLVRDLAQADMQPVASGTSAKVGVHCVRRAQRCQTA